MKLTVLWRRVQHAFGVHRPGVVSPLGTLSCQSRCEVCGARIMMDHNGKWFNPQQYMGRRS